MLAVPAPSLPQVAKTGRRARLTAEQPSSDEARHARKSSSSTGEVRIPISGSDCRSQCPRSVSQADTAPYVLC